MMQEPESRTPVIRAVALGVFLILFGLILGVLAFATLVGPVFGLLLVALGIYIIWKSAASGEPPESVE